MLMLKYFAFQKCVGYIKWWYILSIKLCNGLISVELCLHLFLSEVERLFFFSPICVMLIRYQGQKANRSVVSADFLKRGVVEERHYILLHEKILEDTNGCSSSVTWDVFTLVSKGPGLVFYMEYHCQLLLYRRFKKKISNLASSQ